jgi:hypothetical protein
LNACVPDGTNEAKMTNDNRYGEALSDLRGLLNRWNHDDIRFAEPRRDVAIDVRECLDTLLHSPAGGRCNKIGSRIFTYLQDDKFAQKLVILAAIRHCVRVLEKWNPPAAMRHKYVSVMSQAKRYMEPFSRRCRYEIVCGKCDNKNCPFAHDPTKVVVDNETWLDNLPTQEEFYVAMTV